MTQREQIKFTVRGLSGHSEYNLEPLTRKESLRVFHNVSELLVSGLGGVVQGFTKGEDLDEKAILDISRAFDFDKVYAIGSAVFRAAVIVGEESKHEIGALQDSDYFDDRPEEFYLAIAYAIRANWPKVFFALTRKLRDFGDSEKIKKAVEGLLQKSLKTG